MGSGKDALRWGHRESTASRPSTTRLDDGSYRTTFDPKTWLATEAIVTAVADVGGEDPLDLRPIGTVLDPDALDALFSLSLWDISSVEISISFDYAGFEVTVDEAGTVVLDPLDRDR